MSTFALLPFYAFSMIFSNSLLPVSRFERPISVPPPIIVPETRSKELKSLTLIIDTPEPMLTSNLGNSNYDSSVSMRLNDRLKPF